MASNAETSERNPGALYSVIWTCPGCLQNQLDPMLTPCNHCICASCCEAETCPICDRDLEGTGVNYKLAKAFHDDDSDVDTESNSSSDDNSPPDNRIIRLGNKRYPVSSIKSLVLTTTGTPGCCHRVTLNVVFFDGDETTWDPDEFSISKVREITGGGDSWFNPKFL
jgi:hypothetical protein